MACAVTIKSRDFGGNRKRNIIEITFSGTYTTGGEVPTVPAGWLKACECPTEITKMNVDGGGGIATGVVAFYNHVTNKLQLFRADQIDDFLEEVASAFSLTGVGPLRAEVVGY